MVIENLPSEPINLSGRGGIRGSRTRKDKDRVGKKKQPRQRASQQQPSQIRPRDRNTVHLDGSTLEGGGQLVRVALTLSALTNVPVHITNIRAGRGGGRNSGGLKESHLAALEVLAEECGASVEGAEVGSKEVLFEPGRRRENRGSSDGMERTVKLERPGSVWLILQALLPWFLLQEGWMQLILKGGTNVSSSMSGDYVQQVLLPVLEKIGQPVVRVDVLRRGWAGNAVQIGEVKVCFGAEGKGESDTVKGKAMRPFKVRDRGSISKISISVVAHPDSMRRALVHRATRELQRTYPDVEIDIAGNEDSDDVRRLYILLVAHTSNGWRLGRDYLGTGRALKNQNHVDVLVDGAVDRVIRDLRGEIDAGGCVDEHLQDQLVVFQALGYGMSAVDAGDGRGEGTLHTRTVRWVCAEMLGQLGYKVLDGDGGQCLGIGNDVLGGLIRLHADREDEDVGGKEEDAGGEQLAAAVGHMTWEDSDSGGG